MSRLIREGNIAVVIIGAVGFAAAQRAPGEPELTATQNGQLANVLRIRRYSPRRRVHSQESATRFPIP
jgi:hypothetical protein